MKFIYTFIVGLIIFFQAIATKGETYLLNLEQSITIAKMKSLDMLSLKQKMD